MTVSILECPSRPTEGQLKLWRYTAAERKHRHVHFMYPLTDQWGRKMWRWGCVSRERLEMGRDQGAGGDHLFRAGSPAFVLGIEPIDVSSAE